MTFDVPDGEAGRGQWLAATLAVLTAATFGIAVFTPPLSGPSCTSGCFTYPYTGIEARFPRDYFWMFPAMVLSVVFVAMLVSVHRCAAPKMKLFSQLGLALGLVGASMLLVDYWVQLAVIQPSLLRGETDGVALLSQFNPHGVFIAIEELGFLLMSCSLLCLSPVFWAARSPGRAIAWVLLISFGLSISPLVLISAIYGLQREYRFEIAIISIVWLTLIVLGILLAILFRRAKRERAG